jgi:transcriptional regulator CtsR
MQVIFDNMLRRNQLAMEVTTLPKVIDYSRKVISGQSYFDVENLMEGSKALQSAGIDVKKNFDLINKSAQGIGSDFSALSQIIKRDYLLLLRQVLITERMATNMERTTFYTGASKVLNVFWLYSKSRY